VIVRFRPKVLLYAAAVVITGAFAAYRLAGPEGIPLIIEKRRQVEQLRRANVALKHELQLRRERVRRLAESKAELEREIRRQLRLQKKDEKTFLLPEAKK
jgi:hypothetical protein